MKTNLQDEETNKTTGKSRRGPVSDRSYDDLPPMSEINPYLFAQQGQSGVSGGGEGVIGRSGYRAGHILAGGVQPG